MFLCDLPVRFATDTCLISNTCDVMSSITNDNNAQIKAFHKSQDWLLQQQYKENRKQQHNVTAPRYQHALAHVHAERQRLRAHLDTHVALKHNALAADRKRFAAAKQRRAQQQARPSRPTTKPRPTKPRPPVVSASVLPAVQRSTTAHTAARFQQQRWVYSISFSLLS